MTKLWQTTIHLKQINMLLVQILNSQEYLKLKADEQQLKEAYLKTDLSGRESIKFLDKYLSSLIKTWKKENEHILIELETNSEDALFNQAVQFVKKCNTEYKNLLSDFENLEQFKHLVTKKLKSLSTDSVFTNPISKNDEVKNFLNHRQKF